MSSLVKFDQSTDELYHFLAKSVLGGDNSFCTRYTTVIQQVKVPCKLFTPNIQPCYFIISKNHFFND